MLRNDCVDHYKCWSRLQLLWSLSSLSLIRNVTGDFDTIKISILLLFNNELDNLRENVFANGSKHCLQKRRKTVSLIDLKEWKHPKQWSRCEEKKNSSELWVGGSNNMISFAQILKKKTGSNSNKHVCKLKHAWVELKNEENNCYW